MRYLLFALLALLAARTASAHRLDEYLQATTIDIQHDQVALEVRLTPGVSVLPKILPLIGAAHAGLFSDAEQRAYADRVRRDLSLELNGKPLDLRLQSFSYPTLKEMKLGTGTIVLGFSASTGGLGADPVLTFTNRHEPAIGVYLVNCLAPKQAAVQILGQDRSFNQSSYRLTMRIDPAQGGTRSTAELSDLQRNLDRSGASSTFGAFFLHGVWHILTGYDHLLFVGALVLGASTLWDLIKVVTAFTVAHSITLTLAALNLAHLPSSIVEPLISGSIVFVAVQNVFWPDQSRGTVRLAVAFFFGLFHGLGFAGGLLDLMHGMSPQVVLLAILGFSVGVEAGNQMVLLPLFGVCRAVRRLARDTTGRQKIARTVQRFGSASISLAGTVYLCLALHGA